MSDGPEPGWGGYPEQWPPPEEPKRQQYDPYAQQQWGEPSYAYGGGQRPPERTSGLAIAAFVTSIVSWILIGVLPFVGAIAALAMAAIASGEIRRSGGRVGGEWAVTGTYVIAGAQLAMTLLFLVFIAALFDALTPW